MRRYTKRTTVSLCPEWEAEIKHLKNTKFHDDTQAEIYRRLILRGLEAIQEEDSTSDNYIK